jgi:nanoRNase/pAp phosphatase (c-di-AMP/oligoRNAs hydrolase)
MREALAKAQAEIDASFATARASRVERRVGDVNLVVAVCDGHPSEIADAWGKESQNAVFALYDAKSLAVSLRRSPDCAVDLSHVAASLGGGGHAAASGCQLPELRRVLAEAVADRVAEKLP